jgi:hypothetical protein
MVQRRSANPEEAVLVAAVPLVLLDGHGARLQRVDAMLFARDIDDMSRIFAASALACQ